MQCINLNSCSVVMNFELDMGDMDIFVELDGLQLCGDVSVNVFTYSDSHSSQPNFEQPYARNLFYHPQCAFRSTANLVTVHDTAWRVFQEIVIAIQAAVGTHLNAACRFDAWRH